MCSELESITGVLNMEIFTLHVLISERIPCRLREIQPLSAEQHCLMPTWCKFTEITEGNKENNTERKKSAAAYQEEI